MKPESQLQTQIVSAFSLLARAHGFLFFAPLNEAYLSSAKANKGYLTKAEYARMMLMRKMGFTPGVSDIVLFHAGAAYCLELKSDRGSQSTDQQTFESWCARVGVPYRIARSVEDALRALREWRIIV